MKFKNTLASMVLVGTALSGAALTSVHADVAIIVSPKANINKVDQDVIARIFLGKMAKKRCLWIWKKDLQFTTNLLNQFWIRRRVN